ncbi:Rne/Rng family ribonuclease [Intrasporangium flavum]|uniref:Rne/Rng family ribonuclease n=1 Tax=Intrasporangium flavum TaxID=1428657 RepID=UPI00096EFA91|nr:Rne/Rng family ribonuclease [Intrasporangium flavum]
MAPNDTTASTEGTQAPNLFDGDPTTDAPSAPAPRKRASRRVTKKAAAPAPAPETTTPAGEAEVPPASEGTDAAEGADAAEAAPARAARKRASRSAKAAASDDAPKATRTRRKKAAPAEPAETTETTDTTDTTDTAVAADTTETSTEAPAEEKSGRRRRSSGRDRAAAALEELVASVDEQADADVTDEDTEDTEDVTDTEDGAEPADPFAVVPSFSVLFQAPDTSSVPTRRSRSRRPEPEDHDATDEQPGLDEADTSAAAEADRSGEDQDDREGDDSSPRRSRRRRGGKGRRGRGADAESDQDTDDAPDEDASGEPESGRGRRGRGRTSRDTQEAREADASGEETGEAAEAAEGDEEAGSSRRRRRRRRAGSGSDAAEDAPGVSTRVRQPRSDEPVAVKGSTRLEAKKQRRREGREAGRRRTIITEAEFLARREAVDRVMVVRNKDGRTQMGVLEDDVLVEHYIDQATNVSMAGNIYLGRVQNVLPSMEAAFVDIGKGRNAVLYAGEVNWDAAGLESGQPKRIENALGSGQTVLVQVTKDPIGHKGARLTSQISLPGRYLVYVPNSSMTGISRKLPDTERARLKKILREVVPDSAGVIVRTAAEGASEEELRADVERLTATWEDIQAKAEAGSTPRAGKSKGKKKNGGSGSATGGTAPMLLHGEPDLTVRVIRDVFNEDFKQLVVSGEQAWQEIHPYITAVAPDLADRVTKWTSEEDLFSHHRVDEQLSKAMDRKVWLPSGGSLVIDRTEAMTVVDVNTGKFVGSGGNLEETVTKNNLEAAEEIVRQLRLRDIGGIIVIDFIDMVLESNRDLVVRRLLECLGRDRTKHQVAEVTSLGLVQMTRKRVGSGLIEVFSHTCEHCNGRGYVIHTDPVDKGAHQHEPSGEGRRRGGRGSGGQGGSGNQGGQGGQGNQGGSGQASQGTGGQPSAAHEAAADHKPSGPTAAQIAAAAHAAAIKGATTAAEQIEALEQLDQAAESGSSGSSVDGHPHAFPEDSGPWGGDDAPIAEKDADASHGADAAVPVELESDVPGAVDEQPEPTPEPTPEPEAAPEPEPASEPASEPAPAARGRRRRGRVVAPAGPPKATADGGGDDA